jgi:hypothetical protein
MINHCYQWPPNDRSLLMSEHWISLTNIHLMSPSNNEVLSWKEVLWGAFLFLFLTLFLTYIIFEKIHHQSLEQKPELCYVYIKDRVWKGKNQKINTYMHCTLYLYYHTGNLSSILWPQSKRIREKPHFLPLSPQSYRLNFKGTEWRNFSIFLL